MGNLLDAPITEKETQSGTTTTDDNYNEWGVSSMQGWRPEMEDGHVVLSQIYIEEPIKGLEDEFERIPLLGHSLFAVMDGHGGSFSARYSSKNFERLLCRNHKFVRYGKQFMKNYMSVGVGNVVDGTTTSESTEQQQGDEDELLEMLKEALKDVFVSMDREILLEVKKGTPWKEEYKNAKTSKNNTQEEEDELGGEGGTTILEANLQETDVPLAISSPQQPEEDSGTTVCMILICPKYIVCANAGDSRAVLGRQGDSTVLSLPLSLDHKPDNISERTRIEQAGGFVSDGRVNGDLAVSRSLGDYRFKNISTVLGVHHEQHQHHQHGGGGLLSRFRHRNHNNQDDDTPTTILPEQQQVSPMPDILVQERNFDRDLFVVCACDGIWDVQTNEECCQTISNIFSEGETHMGLVCEELLDYCLEIGSKDNMTALLLKFPAQEIAEGGGGVMARRRLRQEQQDDKHGDDETESREEEHNG